MFRSAWIILASSVVTFIYSILAIISGLISPYSERTNAVVRGWAGLVLKIAGIKLDVHGLEHLKPGQPYIFISNHQSTFDIMSCLAVIPGAARFIAKQELFRVPVFAQGMRAVGMIPIDRGNSKKARESLDKAIVEIKQGVSVIIFPEGTRSKDGNIQPFKKGGFVLALKGGIPIVPMVISGAMQIMRKKSMFLDKGTIRLEFLHPVDTTQYSYDQRNRLLQEVRTQIMERYEQLNKEAQA
jgi:1-acyl-sn-glycerol-3-phosphate acyltransferase